MTKTIDAVAAGHICLDITPIFPASERTKISEYFCPGNQVFVDQSEISLGGPVPNTGMAMKIFGLNLAVMASVGDDMIGELIMDLVRQQGVGAEGIHLSSGQPSSYSVVLAPPGIDRMFLHCTGTNDTFRAADVDFSQVAQARLFHLGYPPLLKSLYENEGKELAEIFAKAKAANVTTSLDMAMPDANAPAGLAPWPVIFAQTLPNVDIFMPSVEEIFLMLERERYLALRAAHPETDLVEVIDTADFIRLGDKALAMGCGIAVIKGARRGYYIRTAGKQRLAQFGADAQCDLEQWADRELWIPAWHVDKIVSGTGSGDASIAAFLVAFLKGIAPGRCAQLACGAGWHCLQAVDALSGLPTWEKLETFVNTRPPIEDPNIDPALFRWDETSGVYQGQA